MKRVVLKPCFDFEDDFDKVTETSLSQEAFCNYLDLKEIDYEIYGPIVKVYEEFTIEEIQDLFNRYTNSH